MRTRPSMVCNAFLGQTMVTARWVVCCCTLYASRTLKHIASGFRDFIDLCMGGLSEEEEQSATLTSNGGVEVGRSPLLSSAPLRVLVADHPHPLECDSNSGRGRFGYVCICSCTRA